MKKTPAWRRYLRFWRANVVEDVDDELRFHVEMRMAEYIAGGMSAEDARGAVLARLGDVDRARAECIALGEIREADARQADFVDALRADVRYALRSLARSPGWTAVALLTIGLGVGATTTVFSVADALLVRPFTYPHASRVFMARRQFVVDGQTIPLPVPYGVLREWREHARTIEAVAPFAGDADARLGSGIDTATVKITRIDTGFLAFAGSHPLVGRNFTADEVTPGGPGAVLLTEQFWRRQYGGSRDVVGTVLQLDGRPSTIVGVVPASLSIPDFRRDRADVLLPLALSLDGGSSVLVRLKPGVEPKVATEELEGILKRSNAPDIRPVPMAMPLHLTRPQDWLLIRQPIVMLTAAVALLLLVACINVAHLLLARGAARQRELAVRHALGAGRSRLLRQLVTESLLLAVLGGALAAFIGWAGLHLLSALRPANLVALTYVSTDRGVLSIAAVLAILCGLVIGLGAALRIAHRDLGLSLRSAAWSTPLGGRRLRGALVVGEVALSATLLVGALLLIHAVFDLQRTQLGFDVRNLYALSFAFPEETPTAQRAAFAAMVRERAARVPGVQAVALAGSPPAPHGMRMIGLIETPEHANEMLPENARASFALAAVAPDYFAMMGMPLLAGRTFDEGSAARNEVIVSTSLAHQLSPNGQAGDALGRRFRNAVARSRGPDDPWQTVIGVVPDALSSLVEGSTNPGIYRPLDAGGFGGVFGRVTLMVRLNGGGAAQLRRFATAVQPPRSQIEVTNVRDAIDETMAEPRFTMRILVVFALLGVLLAAIGLFGVISYSVGQRTREIGVRMTLGATRGSIARLVVGDGIRLALLGIGVGLLGAVAATRLIQKLLYGVSPLDPFSFGVGATLLLTVGIIACVVPMLRATGVDPAIAVRVE